MSALFDFLQKNQIKKSKALPLVHTTEAYFLKKILKSGRIHTSRCDVFSKNGHEEIAYFFVGRPSYKFEVNNESEYWELPTCFLFEYSLANLRRLFPFDSGAFAAKRYPTFIQMMEMSEFQIADDAMATEKLIGTFFGTPSNYYRLKSLSADELRSGYQLEIFNEEILALHKLIRSKSDRFDDRRFSIEAQFSDGFDLKDRKLLAVVLPDIYLESKDLVDKIEGELGAEILSYSIYPLNVSQYYYAIYERVELFYRAKGYFNV
jgi:hypothetical protein